MEHVAIMKKSWGLLPKILNGDKKIESRWYKTRGTPWNRVFSGDIVYFKNSGSPIEIKARVEKVIQIDDLTKEKVRSILLKYGKEDGIEEQDMPKYCEMFSDKKFCILVFFNDVERIAPFQISKNGVGSQTAWVCVDKVADLKRRK